MVQAHHLFGELHAGPDAAELGAAAQDKGWIGDRDDVGAGLQ